MVILVGQGIPFKGEIKAIEKIDIGKRIKDRKREKASTSYEIHTYKE